MSRLTVSPKGHRQEWFHRTHDAVKFNDTYLKGPKESVKELTLSAKSAPLLAVAKAFDHPQLTPVSDWLVENLANRDAVGDQRRFRSPYVGRLSASARLCHENKDFHAWANNILRHADLGIREVEIKVVDQKVVRPVSKPAASGSGRITVMEESMIQHHKPLFIHTGEGNSTASFEEDAESQGTRRLFSMLAPLYEVFQEGQLAVIDEFGTSMHPYLAREIVRLFHNHEINPKGAQLVFATHDTALLSGRLLRRDQVWFTEKDHAGATDLYSLQDLKGVRPSDPLQKGYLGGRYGAIPFFGSLDILPEGQEKRQQHPLSLRLPLRPKPFREQRKTILIATEDTGTGRNYLRRIAAEDAVRQRCTVTFAEHTGSNPKSVVQAAKSATREAQGKFKEIWLVFDTEGPQNPQRTKDAREAFESARQLNYKTAVSNPCFEYWLILHFECFTANLIDGDAACRQLSRHLPGYHKSYDCYVKTRQNLETARKNAEELYNERCDRNQGHPSDCHPCTQVYLLMTSLLGPSSH